MLLSNLNFNGWRGAGSNIYTGSGATVSNDSGSSVVESGIEGVVSGIPFVGGLLSGVLGKLEIGKNIGLVSKYGLSSWGAGQSPENIKAQFAQNVYPWYQGLLESITPENMGTTMTELYVGLKSNLGYHQHLLTDHSNAKSTKLAYKWSIPELKRLLKSVEDMVTALRNNGVTVTVRSYTAATSYVDLKDMAGTIDNSDLNKSPLTFKRFSVDGEALRSLQVNEKGEVVKKSSNGLLALAAVGFGAFKILG